MSVRVIARIRPLLKQEIERDVIVTTATASSEPTDSSNIIRISNPKNDAELYSYQFNSVYGQEATQQEVFDNEISPTVKHLYKGFDVTLFAYGVTGTGKTHTMRGGKSLADRGVIPRLLSSVFRRARKIEKDTAGDTTVEVAMSYYEIYNDRVYDLFEAPEKRTPAGLPIRDNGGKSVVVGLTERPCSTLKEFEQLYDQANVNRSTSATKLNAHSSRSHAILCVKLTQITGDKTLVSRASAIDLAGSEDNRRTENNKERMIESSAINRSLFVLAQCVEAISKKQSRVPYRESKMTRILSLGQNNGLTIMILNLAPVRSYHLDTLSSLNFANRTKKIEVNEIENAPSIRGPPAKGFGSLGLSEPLRNRQPLKQLNAIENIPIADPKRTGKPIVKTISVYKDKPRLMARHGPFEQQSLHTKRPLSSTNFAASSRPSKFQRGGDSPQNGLSKADIEALIERRLDQKLAEKALGEKVKAAAPLSQELQQRLNALEARVSQKEDSEGLQYLLMAKQHQSRGEDGSALRMYQLAQPFFPNNAKLLRKIESVKNKIVTNNARSVQQNDDNHDDEDYKYHAEQEVDDSFAPKPNPRKAMSKQKLTIYRGDAPPSPRTTQLLKIINTKSLDLIKQLAGVGPKKAESIVSSLCEMQPVDDGALITSLEQLGALRGVGNRTLETMKAGLVGAQWEF